MAIDTEAKRKSMLKFSGPSIPVLVFLQGGGIPASDRATILLLYEGIGFDAPAPPSGTSYSISADVSYAIMRKMAFDITNTRPDDP